MRRSPFFYVVNRTDSLSKFNKEAWDFSVKVAIKKIKFTTINKTYTEQVRDWRGRYCFSTQYPNPDGKRIFLTYYFVHKG
jgi:hypothetical protein